jgi:hypothetical protein
MGGASTASHFAGQVASRCRLGEVDPLGAARLIEKLYGVLEVNANGIALPNCRQTWIHEADRSVRDYVLRKHTPVGRDELTSLLEDHPAFAKIRRKFPTATAEARLDANPFLSAIEPGRFSVEVSKPSLLDSIVRGLESLGGIAYYASVSEKINDARDAKHGVSSSSVLAYLRENDDLFLRFEDGVYALRSTKLTLSELKAAAEKLRPKRYTPSRTSGQRVIDVIIEVLQGSMTPLTSQEIWSLCQQRRPVRLITLRQTLSNKSVFRRNTDGTYALAGERQTLGALQRRKRVIDLVEAILTERGQPLRAKDIHSAVQAIRSVAMVSIMQALSDRSKFVLYPESTYGLASWKHVDVQAPGTDPFSEAFEASLRAQGILDEGP